MSYLNLYGTLFFIILNLVNLTIHLIAIFKGIQIYKRRIRSRKNIITFNGHEDVETWPRVSIIKPIVLDDPKIKRLIEPYFQLDYPGYDVHFCFQSSNHSCIQYVNQLALQYPKVKVFVHTEPPVSGYGNRKILNIRRAYKYLRGEYVWIVDENIHAPLTALKELVTQFDSDDIGCVHQVPIWKCRDTLESAINSIFFSGHHARFYLFCDAVGILCVSGMSMIFDKEKLDEIGGIASFEKFLSEDYALTIALAHRGYRIKVAPSPAVQNPCYSDVKLYTDRMIRWSKLRLNLIFLLSILEPLIHPVLFSIISALFLFQLAGMPFLPVFLIYLFTVFAVDQIQSIILLKAFPEQGVLPSWKNRFYAFSILNFLLVPYIFCASVWNFKRIHWHDSVYELSWGTVIIPPPDQNKKSSVLLKRFQRFKELQNELK